MLSSYLFLTSVETGHLSPASGQIETLSSTACRLPPVPPLAKSQEEALQQEEERCFFCSCHLESGAFVSMLTFLRRHVSLQVVASDARRFSADWILEDIWNLRLVLLKFPR